MVSDDEAMATIERMVERAAAESRIVKVEGLGFVVADPDTLRFIEACADYSRGYARHDGNDSMGFLELLFRASLFQDIKPPSSSQRKQ
jgi:hypothetical protein